MPEQPLPSAGKAESSGGGCKFAKRRWLAAIIEPLLLAAARLGMAVIPRLPRWGVLALARTAGVVVFGLMPRRRMQIALANIEVAFGAELSGRAKRRLVCESVCNLVQVVLDLFWFSHDRQRRLQKYLSFDPDFDPAKVPLPAIVVTAHLGNWEILSQAMALRGYHAVIPYAPLHLAAPDQVLQRVRRGIDQEFVPRWAAGRALLRAMHDGRSVALLLDQNSTWEQGGDFVDLFGLPVLAPVAAARLARRSQAPILPLFCVPIAGGRYHVYSRPVRVADALCDPNAPDADVQITQWILQQFEAEIRKHPGLWFWNFRRWRYKPLHAESYARFPFYADSTIGTPRAWNAAEAGERQPAGAAADYVRYPRSGPADKPRTIELLPLVDLERGVFDGEARSADDGLEVRAAKKGRVQLPVWPRGSYEFSGSFTVWDEGWPVSILPIGRSRVLLHWNLRGMTGLQMIHGKGVGNPANPTRVMPSRMEIGKRHAFAVRVACHAGQTEIEVTLDGQPHLHWSGPESIAAINVPWELPDAGTLGVGVEQGQATFHELRLKMLSGELWLHREASAALPQRFVSPQTDTSYVARAA